MWRSSPRRSKRAFRDLIAAGYTLVVITNQAIVGRGILTEEYISGLNRRILDRFGELGGAPSASRDHARTTPTTIAIAVSRSREMY